MAAGDRTGKPDHRTALLWTIAAVVLGLAVLVVNRGPLYYFDSAGYYLQGNSILSVFLPESALETTGGGGSIVEKENDAGVTISRSPVYAVLVAAFWNLGALFVANIANLLAVFLAAFLIARAMSRNTDLALSTLTLTSAPIAIASLTSLSFYVAYVMPDTFIGIAILLASAIAAFSRHLKPWELLFAFLLLAFALVVHRSHLLIVLLLVPFAVVGAIVAAGRRGWIAAGLMALAVVVGFAEIKSYSVGAQKVTGQDVTMPPFLTARIIEDGPGYVYLQENCPEIGIATCALADALALSDDPFRLTAAHIAFETSEQLGSFKLMTLEDQRRVSAEQTAFYLRVFADYPLQVIQAVLRNTMIQTTDVSIRMTIPDKTTMDMVHRTTDPAIDFGTLAHSRDWIAKVDAVHEVIYLISMAAILILLVLPGRSSRQIRVFAALVIIGMLINAFVCGAVSQPAPRYGARVAWLLPFVATLLTLVAFAPKLSSEAREQALRGNPEPAR